MAHVNFDIFFVGLLPILKFCLYPFTHTLITSSFLGLALYIPLQKMDKDALDT